MREHRNTAYGLADCLNYAVMVAEGILLLKDGAFLGCFDYRGPDLNSAGASELEYLSAIVNNTLCSLGDGWMVQGDLIRQPSHDYPAIDANYFPDPTSRLIDEERRQQYVGEGLHFESVYRLSITYLPPTDQAAKLQKLFISGQDKTQPGWEVPLQFFQQRLSALQNSLSNHLIITPLTSQALLTYLHQTVTGLTHEVRLPPIPMYLDNIIASHDFIGGLAPKIGENYISLIGITGFPLQTEPGVLSALENLSIAFRLSNRFICLDSRTATQQLKVYRRNWLQKRHGLMGLIKSIFTQQENDGFQNRDALTMTDDADVAVAEAESGAVRYGYYTSVIVLMDASADVVAAQAKLMIKTLEARSFNGRLETVNAVEAYLGSLPGHGYQNVRKPLIHSLNFADLLPLTSVWAGLTYSPCAFYPPQSPPLLYAATSGATPFRFSPHVGDVGHTFIFGRTGDGKSTLINLMAAQHLRYPNAQIWWFDKGYSAYTLCKALKGQHYDLAGESEQIAFQPLADIHLPAEFTFACHWVESLVECQGIAMTPALRNEIHRALTLLREADVSHRTISHLQGSVQNAELKAALEYYTIGGAMGQILDAQRDSLQINRLQVFEMQHLMQLSHQATFPTLLYLFRQFERALRQDRPTLIFIEEGHLFLQGQFGEQLVTWLRELRKANAAVIFLTQNLAEVANSPHKTVLRDNAPTRIFLPNHDAATPDNSALYKGIGLTDRQIELIAQGTPKQDYYYTSPLGQRMMDLGLGRVALALLTVNMKDVAQRRALDAFATTHGDRWVYEWLKAHELTEWAEYWLTLFETQTVYTAPPSSIETQEDRHVA